MKIPKAFEVMGRSITVKMVPNLSSGHDIYGRWWGARNLIELQTPDDDHSEDVIGQAFWHEAVHAILESCGRTKLSENERFVEILGQCLHQIDKSRR